MADVTDRRGGDRGQIILVLGLVIAVMFVALVTLLNSVIYAETLASRGSPLTGGDPIEFRSEVVVGTGRVIDAENDEYYGTFDAVRKTVLADLQRLETVMRRRHARRGTALSLSQVTLHEGRLLGQNVSREMTNESDAANWTLATDVRDVRAFRLNVTGGLHSTTNPANAFRVVLNDSNAATTWAFAIYDNATGHLTLAVHDETGWTTGVCDPPSSPPVRIDLTAGTVEGERCDAIEFGEGVSPPYDLSYLGGDLAKGTYTLTVNVSGSAEIVGSSFHDPGGGSPFAAPAVYDALLTLHYETSQVTYETRVRVAPGEPDG